MVKLGDTVRINTHFSFEAPLVQAKIPLRTPIAYNERSTLDLNEYLVERPDSTFFVRVTGESMIGKGIYDGDILVVDTSIHPKDGRVVVAAIEGELAVKTLRIIRDQVYLYSENERYLPIEILGHMHFKIWGVVKHVIHEV